MSITITLKTLPKATEQQVLDQVATHLLTQNERSVNQHNRCRYRYKQNGTTLKCAAGCLIADREYTELMENKRWSHLVETRSVPPQHRNLITSLQAIHDGYYPRMWLSELESLARNFNLSTVALKEQKA